MSPRRADRDGFREMELAGVRVVTTDDTPFALLKETRGNRCLPVRLGPFEGLAITIGYMGMTSPRPLTHDLIRDVLQAASIQLLNVRITSLADGICYSDLILSNGSKVVSRADDGIALAIRTGATIEAAEEIISEAGRPVDAFEPPVDSTRLPAGQPPVLGDDTAAPGRYWRNLTIPRSSRPVMEELEFAALRVIESSNEPVVLVREMRGNRYLQIQIGAIGAVAIASAQQNVTSPVSVTHDLFHAILRAVNIQLLSVRITSLTDGVFYSELVLSNGREVSSRPVDGIALAIRTGATIEAAAEILYGAAVEINDEV